MLRLALPGHHTRRIELIDLACQFELVSSLIYGYMVSHSYWHSHRQYSADQRHQSLTQQGVFRQAHQRLTHGV